MIENQQLGELGIDIDIDFNKFNSELSKVQDKVGQTSQKIDAQFKQTFKKISNYAKTAALAVGASIGAITTISLKTASDAEEINSKFKVVFGSLADEADKFAKALSSKVGRATQDVKKQMAELQNLFVPLGYSREEALKLSETIVELGIDVASFENKLDAKVLEDFQSALLGNHETVKKYGAVISEASMQQMAYSMGINKSYKELTDQEKILIRLNIIIDANEDAMGDATRTSSSFANQLKRLDGNIKNIREEIGRRMLPVFNEIVTKMNKWVKNNKKRIDELASDFADGVNKMVYTGKSLFDFFGGIEGVISKVSASIKSLVVILTIQLIVTITETIKTFIKLVTALASYVVSLFKVGSQTKKQIALDVAHNKVLQSKIGYFERIRLCLLSIGKTVPIDTTISNKPGSFVPPGVRDLGKGRTPTTSSTSSKLFPTFMGGGLTKSITKFLGKITGITYLSGILKKQFSRLFAKLIPVLSTSIKGVLLKGAATIVGSVASAIGAAIAGWQIGKTLDKFIFEPLSKYIISAYQRKKDEEGNSPEGMKEAAKKAMRDPFDGNLDKRYAELIESQRYKDKMNLVNTEFDSYKEKAKAWNKFYEKYDINKKMTLGMSNAISSFTQKLKTEFDKIAAPIAQAYQKTHESMIESVEKTISNLQKKQSYNSMIFDALQSTMQKNFIGYGAQGAVSLTGAEVYGTTGGRVSEDARFLSQELKDIKKAIEDQTTKKQKLEEIAVE